MNATVKKFATVLGLLALTASATATANPSAHSQLFAQGTDGDPTGKVTAPAIKIDGSSTVYPITQAIVKLFQADPSNKGQVEVKFSGTTGGFEKFCAGKTDINDASRPISLAEMETCKKNGVRYMEFPIAFDALTIAINPQNDWAKDITVAELKKIWEPAAQGKILRWKQVRALWPDRPLKLFGAGDKSGTFDYFNGAISGKSKASRKDYTPSEDDEALVEGISKDPNALGYFGYAYYQENQSKLKLLPVDNGKGAILPSTQTVEKNQYQPLSRPLFIYVNLRSSANRQVLGKFVRLYINKVSTVADSVGYVPLPERVRDVNYINFNRGKTGTVFSGKARINSKISDLLPKKPVY
ncbi:PstS family phosphate ABC transporter substrate-binding protein [Chamaesiphon sp. VAR_48_metabat_135_sub]|uniref:PstS family phosphate ABC transporter substrate-binding protein n=1 Tax=Chamaesiphon sp. VAR_48_metabat_135_sub TaxID=2964699 RepID=UPI00286B9940|nr:PstS family phosphate ABC transporter substrate-binding protein [Chamaesiphon sp. VAR_48_metabat_135_sub]